MAIKKKITTAPPTSLAPAKGTSPLAAKTPEVVAPKTPPTVSAKIIAPAPKPSTAPAFPLFQRPAVKPAVIAPAPAKLAPSVRATAPVTPAAKITAPILSPKIIVPTPAKTTQPAAISVQRSVDVPPSVSLASAKTPVFVPNVQPQTVPATIAASTAEKPVLIADRVAEPSAKKAVVEASVPRVESTNITALIDIGFGNKLYIRGEGPGLSWSRGVMMNCIADNQWRIALRASSRPVAFKFCVNDLTWNAGENYTAGTGAEVMLTPTF